MTQGFRQKKLTTRVLHANQATFKFSHRDEKYFQELSGASQCGRCVKNLVWFRSVLRCDPTTKNILQYLTTPRKFGCESERHEKSGGHATWMVSLSSSV